MLLFIAAISLCVFTVAIAGALLLTEFTFQECAGVSAMAASMAFVAASLLIFRDHRRRLTAKQRVRRLLLRWEDFTEQAPERHSIESSLLVQTRKAVADFFDVPMNKIRPTDNFELLEAKAFEPHFHFFVIEHVLRQRHLDVGAFTIRLEETESVADFARKIHEILERSTCAAGAVRSAANT